jgi:Flp pilus assembly pilin Flp
MTYLYLWLKTWLSEEEGQDLIEYVLIGGLIAVIAVLAIGATGTNVNAVWEDLRDATAGA